MPNVDLICCLWRGKGIYMEWEKPIFNKKTGEYNIPDSWLFIHYYEALNILFRFENALRLFVYIVLKKEFGKKWFDIALETEDGATTTISAISKKRKNMDEKYGYIGYSLYSPMLYLTSGELIRIIFNKSYWKYFSNYFPGSMEVIKNKFDEISNVRNDLAHFRPLKEDDVEVVKQNVKHIMQKIEKKLYSLLNINIKVPTNCEELWFKEIREISNEYCILEIFQNKGNEYINISFKYNISILQKVKCYKGMNVSILNINAIEIQKKHNILTEKAIYITELVPPIYGEETIDNKFTKSVNFVFPKSVLATDYPEVKNELESLIHEIQVEVEMILADNSARGNYIYLQNIRVTENGKESKYTFTGDDLKSNPKLAPIEYWGSTDGYWDENIISNLDAFPWMPVAISNVVCPF